MRPESIASDTFRNILSHALVYSLWFVNAIVCVLALMQIQAMVVALWVAVGGDRYTLSFVNQVCLLLGGFIAFVYVISLESHYHESISLRLTNSGLGILLRRFAITTAIPMGVWLASLAALEIALRIL